MTTASPKPSETAERHALPFGRDVLLLIERSLNRQIAESTAAKDKLARLDGTSFAVHVRGSGIQCALRAADGRVTLDPDTVNATATLRASPFDLLRLARASGVTAIKGTQAELSGDLQVAERFADLLKLARPDLEEELARWIGDVPAHALGRAALGAAQWLRRAGDALRMNTAEYLTEETRALPAALEAQAFYSDVERLRDDVERAAARLARLERR